MNKVIIQREYSVFKTILYQNQTILYLTDILSILSSILIVPHCVNELDFGRLALPQ